MTLCFLLLVTEGASRGLARCFACSYQRVFDVVISGDQPLYTVTALVRELVHSAAILSGPRHSS
jgi:hypothetical protein